MKAASPICFLASSQVGGLRSTVITPPSVSSTSGGGLEYAWQRRGWREGVSGSDRRIKRNYLIDRCSTRAGAVDVSLQPIVQSCVISTALFSPQPFHTCLILPLHPSAALSPP